MESTTKVRTIKSLTRDIKNGKINFNHLVQRQSNQWNKKQKELLIDSLLNGIVLPQVVFVSIEKEMMPIMDIDDEPGTTYENYIEKINYCVDGKQRLTTIYDFINSKEYKELEEDDKDKILSAEISTITYHNISDDEIFTLFQRYNNGVSLAGGQKTRSYCDKEVLDVIHRHLPHHSITDIWNITKGQLSKNEDEMVVFQSMMLLDGFEYKNFSNKEVERFLQETSKEELLKLYDVVNDNMDKIFDYLVDKDGEVIKYKNLKKIHLPMIIASYQDTDTWKNKLYDFLNDYSSENSEYDEYRSHCTTGTSQKEHVQGRLVFWNN